MFEKQVSSSGDINEEVESDEDGDLGEDTNSNGNHKTVSS